MGFQVGEIVKFKGINMYIDEIIKDGAEKYYILSDGYDKYTVSEDTVIDCMYLREPSKKIFKLNF